MIYNITRENGEVVNKIAWFGNQQIEGCNNAILLTGGDLLLLKTERVIPRKELQELRKDRRRWLDEFGSSGAVDTLRGLVGGGLWHFEELNK